MEVATLILELLLLDLPVAAVFLPLILPALAILLPLSLPALAVLLPIKHNLERDLVHENDQRVRGFIVQESGIGSGSGSDESSMDPGMRAKMAVVVPEDQLVGGGTLLQGLVSIMRAETKEGYENLP